MILKQYNRKKLSWGVDKIILLIALNFFIMGKSFGQKIDLISIQNLSLELYNESGSVGSATGFIVTKNNKNYLITNLHVVTGLDYFSNAVIAANQTTPKFIAIWHNGLKLGSWFRTVENLYNPDGSKKWVECEKFNGKTIDLIALPLINPSNSIKFYPLDFKQFNDSMIVFPGSSVSIVGFPNGIASGGKFAIWKTGHIASDYNININGLPMFMIDATTRPGMSGSMVVYRTYPFFTNQGLEMGLGIRFLGIYAAQSNQEELGYVIKQEVLKKLIDKLP